MLLVGGCLGAPATASAAAPVEPYQTNDFKGFHDVLPPGTNGLANGPGLAAFLSTGARPAHSDDQLAHVRATSSTGRRGSRPTRCRSTTRTRSFGVKPGDVERTYSPGGRDDVTIVRDKSFGVPHIYGDDARRRHVRRSATPPPRTACSSSTSCATSGRAQLASFAGGAPGNRAFDQMQWSVAPYTEADLQKQIDSGSTPLRRGGRAGAARTPTHYVAGINQYIAEAKLDPTKMPGEYAAIDQPPGPEPWKATDIIATASLVGGIFGKGGGGELEQAQLLQAFSRTASAAPRDASCGVSSAASTIPRRADTIKRQALPLPADAAQARAGRRRDPRQGLGHRTSRSSRAGVDARGDGALGAALAGAPRRAAGASRARNSNALVVSARKSESGHPIAVFGPQVAYFAPQILMEQDVHAPGIDARGAVLPGREPLRPARPRARLLVERHLGGPGHHRHVRRRPVQRRRLGSDEGLDHYMFRGQCLPMEMLRRTNTWTPDRRRPDARRAPRRCGA